MVCTGSNESACQTLITWWDEEKRYLSVTTIAARILSWAFWSNQTKKKNTGEQLALGYLGEFIKPTGLLQILFSGYNQFTETGICHGIVCFEHYRGLSNFSRRTSTVLTRVLSFMFHCLIERSTPPL